MTKSHCSSKDIYFGCIQVQEHHVGQSHDCKRLIDFMIINVTHFHTGILECDRHCKRRSHCKVDWVSSSITKSQNSCQWFNAHVDCVLFRHEYKSSCTVIEGTRICCSDRSFLSIKCRCEGRQLVQVDRIWFFILGNNNRIAPSLRNTHWNNLFKDFSFQGFLSSTIGFNGICILFFSREIIINSTLFGTHAHVLIIITIP
mmetsp:Transcript_20381/g.36967  ORF Transcript_20381/g.36967 Transcript_20381/m.36967 type:complete len:201 (+) Transcript_20381:171-773(+)